MANNESKSKDNPLLNKTSIGLVGLAIALLVGFAVATAQGGDSEEDTSDSHSSHSEEKDGDHSDDDDHDHDHDHSDAETYEYEDEATVPSVEIHSLEENSEGKWVLDLDFENFTIDESAVDSENEPGVGHMHVYVNNEKVTRLFSDSYTFDDDLTEGDKVLVELNTNDHKVYTHDGEHIETGITVGDEGVMHDSSEDSGDHDEDEEHSDHDHSE